VSGLLRDVAAYYSGRLAQHGPTPRGADWNSVDSQQIRFRQLLRAIDTDTGSVLDYGCGYGALADDLHAAGRTFDYQGFDISADMIGVARTRHDGCAHCRFTSDPSEVAAADYTLASGIFNVKLQYDDDTWRDYMLATIDTMLAHTRRALAFNVLTAYSDPERQRKDLYYADPLWLFDHCKRHVTPSVALLHDYPLYEFTLILRLAHG
jgi:SAM-dependent methyltransferase